MGAGNPTIHRPSRPSSVTLPTSRRGGGRGWKGSEIQRVQSARHAVSKYLSSTYYAPGHQREWHGPVPMSQSLPSGCGEGRVSDKHTPRGNGGEAGAPRTRSGGAGARSAEVRASSRDSAGGAGESVGAHAEARAPQWSGAAAGRGEGPLAWVSCLRLAVIWRGATAGAGPGRGAGSVGAELANVSCAQGSARETAPGTPPPCPAPN